MWGCLAKGDEKEARVAFSSSTRTCQNIANPPPSHTGVPSGEPTYMTIHVPLYQSLRFGNWYVLFTTQPQWYGRNWPDHLLVVFNNSYYAHSALLTLLTSLAHSPARWVSAQGRMSNTYTLEHSTVPAGLVHSSVFHKHYFYDICRDTEIAVEPTMVPVLSQHPIITKYNVPNHSCSRRRKEASARTPVAY